MSQERLSSLIHRLKSRGGILLPYRGGSAMRKTKHLVFGIGALIFWVVSLIFSRPAQAGNETITLETYYPAPYGIYNEFTTTGKTLLATEEGNVGIGTKYPWVKFQISAGTNSTSVEDLDYIHLDSNDWSLDSGDRWGIRWTQAGNAILGGIDMMWDGITDTLDYRFDGYTGGLETDLMTIKGNGNVGIGTTNPEAKLHVSEGNILITKNGQWASVIIYNYPDQAKKHPAFIGLRGRGNKDAPQYPLVGDGLAAFVGRDAKDGVTQELAYGGGSMYMIAAENFSSTNKGTYIVFSTTKIGENQPVNRVFISPEGNLGIGLMPASAHTLDISGSAWCTGNIWGSSDLRWKKNIVTLPGPLEKLSRLRGVEFDWKREEFKENNFPEGRQIGIIAQELEKEFPELVSTDNAGYKSIAYDKLTAVLLEAVKELEEKIQKQGDLLRSLERELKDQKAEIENLKRKN